MGVQVPELKQCVQSFHFIVLSSSLSSLLVLLLFREILLFVVFVLKKLDLFLKRKRVLVVFVVQHQIQNFGAEFRDFYHDVAPRGREMICRLR